MPGVELRPQLPGPVDDLGQAPVASGEPGLQHGFFRSVEVEFQARTPHLPTQEGLFRPDFLHGVGRDPLEGGVGLGDEGAHPGVDPGPFPQHLAAFLQDGLAQVRDGFHVVQGLPGMANHEVEFDGGPAPAVDFPGRFQELLCAHRLIDDVAHAFRRGLGGQGEPATAGLLQGLHELDGESLDTQRGQGDGHLTLRETPNDLLHQRQDVRVV